MIKSNLQKKKRIEAIKKTLMSLNDFRPGTLTKQYVRRNQKQYEYYQLSYTHKMKSRTRYIPTQSVKTIKKEIRTYKLFKKLFQQWIDLSIQASDDRMKATKKKK
jgi:hypothetical protein